MTSCKLIEKTPNQAFVNAFLEEVHTNPEHAYTWTSSDFQAELSLEDFLTMASGDFSQLEKYTSYVQTTTIGSTSVELGTSKITDYGEFTSVDGELVPGVVYLISVNGNLEINGIYSIQVLIRESLKDQIGTTDLTIDEIDYDSISRVIEVSVTYLNQDGEDITQEFVYNYQGGDNPQWVIGSDL
jgi:hypothetical protein